MIVEAQHAARKQLRALQEVINDDGLEDVELEIPHGAPHVDRNVVPHHLTGKHGQRFHLRWISPLPGIIELLQPYGTGLR